MSPPTLMVTPHMLLEAARNVADPSPPAEAAKIVCMLRQQQPYDFVQTPGGPAYRWQAVLVEAALLRQLGETA